MIKIIELNANVTKPNPNPYYVTPAAKIVNLPGGSAQEKIFPFSPI
jgi:hypothetical protein